MDQFYRIKEFVLPYYQNKDLTHDLSHIERVRKKAQIMKARYHINNNLLDAAIYFHGIIKNHESEIRVFIKNILKLKDSDLEKIIQFAKESLKSNEPQTLEGKILYDAHLLEGGPHFFFLKNLITGTLLGQSMPETLNYFEKNILYKFSCCLEENQKELEHRIAIAKIILDELKEDFDCYANKIHNESIS